ncbi:MAG: hypothetical protein ACI4T3_04820 [Lactobacillus sp.]|jgi:hypothetical protein
MKKDRFVLKRDEYIKYLVYPKAFQIVFWLEEIVGAAMVAFLKSNDAHIIGTVLLGVGVFAFLIEIILTIFFSFRN